MGRTKGRSLGRQFFPIPDLEVKVGDHIVCQFLYTEEVYRVDKICSSGPNCHLMLTDKSGRTKTYHRTMVHLDLIRKLETPTEIALYGISAPIPWYCVSEPNPILKFFLNLKKLIGIKFCV